MRCLLSNMKRPIVKQISFTTRCSGMAVVVVFVVLLIAYCCCCVLHNNNNKQNYSNQNENEKIHIN